MSRTMHLIFVTTATAVVALVAVAAAYDLAVILGRPLAPYFSFMLP